MFAVYAALLSSPLAGKPSITDLRGLEAVSIVGFERLVKALTERRADWLPVAGRQAILHGASFPDALVLGAFQLAASDFELAAFDDEDRAFAWAGAAGVQRDVAALRESLFAVPDIVRRVRVAFEAHEGPLSVVRLARELGMSVRSLQRHLAAAGSSVRAERQAHVLARAEKLLADTDLDLAAIAAAVGLPSASRLVALFKSKRKTTPNAWRRAAR
jgi:AraC-like DNA-binding protein